MSRKNSAPDVGIVLSTGMAGHDGTMGDILPTDEELKGCFERLPKVGNE